jgi:hypothetical protein
MWMLTPLRGQRYSVTSSISQLDKILSAAHFRRRTSSPKRALITSPRGGVTAEVKCGKRVCSHGRHHGDAWEYSRVLFRLI